MKPKTLLILTVICLVLGGLTYWRLSNKPASSESGSKVGNLLFEHLPVNDITAISLRTKEETIGLKRAENCWQVENRNNFLADFEQISDFLRKLKRLKIERSFEIDGAIRDRQALHTPGSASPSQGTQVELKTSDGKRVAHFILGKERQTGGNSGMAGSYLLPVKSPEVYLVNEVFWDLGQKAFDWLAKTIADIPAEEVKAVRAVAADGKTLFHLIKPEKGQAPVWKNQPPGKTLSIEKVDTLFSALEDFSLEDVAPQATSALTPKPAQLEYQLFNGSQVTLNLFVPKQDKSPWGEVTIAVEAPSESTQGVNSPEDAAQSEAKPNIVLPDHPEKWRYKISRWQFDKLVANPEDLFQKKSASPEAAQ